MYEVINLGTKRVACYVINITGSLIVVDSGYPGGFEDFMARFTEAGFVAAHVKYLFLTHSHDDHAGFLKEQLAAFPKAKLILHREAAERIKLGRNLKIHIASSKKIQKVCKLLEFFKLGEHKFPAVNAPNRYLLFEKGGTQYLKEDKLDIEIVALPGHTTDSIGLMLPGKRLICGDAVFNMPKLSKCYYPLVLEGVLALQKTWKYILENAITLLPSHGNILSVDCIRAYWDGLGRLQEYPIYSKRRQDKWH